MNKTLSQHRRKQVCIDMEGQMQCDWKSSRMNECDRVEWHRVEAHLIAWHATSNARAHTWEAAQRMAPAAQPNKHAIGRLKTSANKITENNM
jgi:hypothetical protein